MIDWSNPPCRICGSSRDAHGTMWNHDHRFRGEIRCDYDGHDKPATWYVNGQAACSTHKGREVRIARDGGTEWELRLDRIRRER